MTVPQPSDPNYFAELQKEQIRHSIKKVSLSLVENQFRHRIPEHVFVQNFLDFFSGRKKDASGNSLVNWIAIAGSPTSEVELFDNSGKTVAIVPAIFDTSFLSNSNDGLSISRLSDRYELEKTNPIYNADANFANDLMKKIPAGTSSSETEDRWKNLINRYTIPSDKNQSNKENAQNQISGQNEDLDFGDI